MTPWLSSPSPTRSPSPRLRKPQPVPGRHRLRPLIPNPTQIDYADYRDTGGVKIPYRWTVARPGGRFTIQVDEVQQNVAIDDSKFTKPPAQSEAQPAK